MFRRPSNRRWFCLVVACCVSQVLAAGGCQMMTGAMYLIRGNMVKAQYAGLAEKRVAVVCRPPASLVYADTKVSSDIARAVGTLLKANLKKKITVIDHSKVAAWTDENDWEDYTEIGKAVDAEMVVAIDLHHFSLQEETTLYQGKASVVLTVYDMTNGGEEVFQREMPQSLFPPNSPIPSADRPENEFRRQFVMILSEQIARHFYDHEANLDFAMDSKAL